MERERPAQWLSLVGICENGVEGLSTDARKVVSEAALVIGGKRHLALVRELIHGEAQEWPSPLDKAIEPLLARKPQPVCVLASGDPFTYGIGGTLSRYIPVNEMRVFSAPSIFTLAAAKLGWALQDTLCTGINGRPLERLIPHLQPGAKMIALSADETTPALLASLLERKGFGQSRLTVLEHVGGPQERIRTCAAAAFGFNDIARLNCVAIDIEGEKAQALPLSAGLADDRFLHDGQLTKREVRAVTLSALAPRRGELLWDIGAGAGSIAIEWSLRHASMRAVAIEKDAQRLERAKDNVQALGTPDIAFIHGEAPACFSGLEAPDAIFIGGGATAPGMLDMALHALKPEGRLVVNAVTLETAALLLDAYKRHGGALIRIAVERAEPVGRLTGFKPAMTVTQWSIIK